MTMSGSDEEAIRKRADRLARADARKARLARQEAREAAELAAKHAEQQRLVAEAKAARERGAMPAEAPARKWKPKGRPGKAPVLGHRVVDDPLAIEPGTKMVAVTNLAEHPLEMMLARGRLTTAQYEAGVRFRMLYEQASIGPSRAIDPAKIKVDGGSAGDPLTDAVIHAHRELARIMPMLGKRGSPIVVAVCGLGEAVAALAQRYDGYRSANSNRDFITLRLKEALDVLSEEVWGTKGPEHGRICGERGLGGEVYDEQAVAVANQSYLRRRGLSL